jgi:hypothetical protein
MYSIDPCGCLYLWGFFGLSHTHDYTRVRAYAHTRLRAHLHARDPPIC